MLTRSSFASLLLGASLVTASDSATFVASSEERDERTDGQPVFVTSDRCVACHKGVTRSDGLDVSIGYEWRATMMANSGRDPYWQAAVRREITDHPDAAPVIENECSRCHMPMANETARAAGGMGAVFANLPVGRSEAPGAALAADGVSCAVCHQVTPEGFGSEESFTGGFQISREAAPPEGRAVYGPFEPDTTLVGIMHSATGYQPGLGEHVQQSELCATCHTLQTHAILAGGGEGPRFPEQVPYLEWKVSAYSGPNGSSCQDCHMPVVGEDVPVTGVLGHPRPEVSRHAFRGGNFFMLRVLNRYRTELGVLALPLELSLAAERTEAHLRESTASLALETRLEGGRLVADVDVRNLAGHKFPTAYPSRRVWLHVTVTDARGRDIFESGRFSPDGRIVGNDNDQDGSRYEPHYAEITRGDQVQIYEAIMLDQAGAVTTGLLRADRWAKENRLLPDGFDAARGDERIAVFGGATSDSDFGAGGDRIPYAVDVNPSAGPFTVTAELWYQPIGYRWAENLGAYETFETQRFVRYYREMASGSAILIASASGEAR